MNMEHVYETLLGERLDPYPGIDNAFAPGSHCATLYAEIYQANQRLCNRLGVEEDPDVEQIIDNFFEISRELSFRMFQCGQQHPG